MWEINNYNQVITFLLSCALGGIFCAVYDIVRGLRRVCMNSLFAITLVDILLCALYAMITFMFLMSRTNGEIRGYAIFGVVLGFLLFRISISRFTYRFLKFLFLKISSFVRAVAYLFYKKFELICSKIRKCAFKILKSVKKLLKNIGRLLYTDKNNLNAEHIQNETKAKT